jgi:hypothetical protein
LVKILFFIVSSLLNLVKNRVKELEVSTDLNTEVDDSQAKEYEGY